MIVFDDYDPDDAWDATDTIVEQLRVLVNRVAWLADHRDDLGPRVDRLVADLDFVRHRLIGDI